MNRGNFFRRAVSMLFIVAIMTFAAVSHAEIYIGEGSYCMSEGENLSVAKERAKADAMRNACEKAGTYVKSYSRARNLELEEDIIETMTANILKLLEEKYLPYEQLDNLEGLMIRIVIKVQIDDSDITRWLNKDESEKSILVSQMEDLRKSNEEQSRQIEELKRQLAKSTTKEDKELITKKFSEADKVFLSNKKLDRAWKLWEKKDFNEAKNLFDEAVKLNPSNAGAYCGRGTAYGNLKQYELAIQDLDKAIKLNPKYDYAYNNRGVAYSALGQTERAIQDFNKTIKLNPNYAKAYNNRGAAYKNLGEYERAIQDCDKAIQLNPNYDMAYCNRGVAYNALGQYERAIQDYNKAITLNAKYDIAYYNRGWAYYLLKHYQQAIKDFDKALELNPNFELAKINRKECLKAMGK